MTLLSLTVFAWFAATVVCAWTLPRKWQPFTIAFSTVMFLSFYSPLSLFILTGTSFFVFFLLKKNRTNSAVVILCIGVVGALFAWFKIDSLSAAHTNGGSHIMPLGISYYSCRQIHYIFETYKQKLEGHAFSDYLCYLFFLPTIHVGPIHRFPEFLRDLRRRRWDAYNLSAGLERVLYGYAKIVILGNYLISGKFNHAISGFEVSRPIVSEYLKSVSYWMNLYFQFSGYSDIAIGFSLMTGFHVMENFNYPFLAKNILEFWQRWHISLTSWCKDYVYLPVASLTRRPLVSLFVALIILGLWHEFSGRYVLWGIYHALGIAVWHAFQSFKKRLPAWENRWGKLSLRYASSFLTFNFVMGSFVVSNHAYRKLLAFF